MRCLPISEVMINERGTWTIEKEPSLDIAPGVYVTTEKLKYYLENYCEVSTSVRSLQRLAEKIDSCKVGKSYLLNLDQAMDHYKQLPKITIVK